MNKLANIDDLSLTLDHDIKEQKIEDIAELICNSVEDINQLKSRSQELKERGFWKKIFSDNIKLPKVIDKSTGEYDEIEKKKVIR